MVVCSALLWLLCAGAAAQAQESRSYRIADVRIDAEVAADGSLRVSESRTFSYDGTYRGALYGLPLHADQRVRDFAVRDSTGVEYVEASGGEEPGTYVVTHRPGDFEATWFYATPATDEERTFTIDYVVEGAATRHDDAAQLYWEWVGDGWDVPTDHLIADVRLPNGAVPLRAGDNLLLWGQGPEHGRVLTVGDRTVRAEVSGLAPNQHAGIRVLMPPELLDETASDGTSVRDEVIAEETARARGSADADRRSRPGSVFPGFLRDVFPGFLPDLGDTRSVLALLLAAVATATTGAVALQRRVADRLGPGDLQVDAPSDDHPALVAWLVGRGRMNEQAIVATILRLGEAGIISISERPHDDGSTTTVFHAGDQAEHELDVMVNQMLATAAGGRPDLTDDELLAWAKKHPAEARRRWRAFTARVGELATARGWAAQRSVGSWAVRLVGFTLVAAGFVTFLALSAVIGWILLLAGTLVGRGARHRPLSPAANDLRRRWRGFGAYLRDTAGWRGASGVSDLDAWMPYAVVLGAADQVAARVRTAVTVPDVRPRPAVPALWRNPQLRRALRVGTVTPSSTGRGGRMSSGGSRGGGGGSRGGAF